MSNKNMDLILEGIQKRKRPLELKDALTIGEKQAKKMDAPQDKWAVEQRNRFMTEVYHICMRELSPQGFDDKFIGAALSGDLASFYANEVKVDTYSPREWRTWFIDYMTDFMKKNEKKWIESRYEFTEKDGKTYVRSFW